ncbi:MAG TPA: hypothetical protein VNZ64_21200 [Candidatus Acidoferrum sp.]|nr:hypothetical protein [Candidatus Acidoferrum sp.]
MRFTGRKFAWIAVFTVVAAFLAVWLGNWREEVREAHGDFKWFSTLGFPDAKGLAWARVATGRWSQSQGQPPKNHYVKGFLLATNDANFTVFTVELLTQTMTNSRPGAPEHERVGFEVLDLRRDVADRLQQLRHAPGGDNLWPLFARRLPEQAEVFALVWACWRQGLDSEARSLYQEAKLLFKDVVLQTLEVHRG